jgi:hypothetical protein
VANLSPFRHKTAAQTFESLQQEREKLVIRGPAVTKVLATLGVAGALCANADSITDDFSDFVTAGTVC